jgi:hypothetical protein
MKKFKLLPILILIICASCNGLSTNKDIEKVKSSTVSFGLGGGYVVGDLVKEITGLDGTAKWDSFQPESYKDNPNVVCVQVDITRKKEKNNLVSMQYLLNRETGLVKTGSLRVDGKGLSILEFYMLLIEIGIDNIK